MDRARGHLPRQVQKTSPAKQLKILSLGEPNTGKSCIIKRFCEGRFTKDYVATIGIDYGVKNVMLGDVSVRVNFWDVAGDRVYYEVRSEFYADTGAAMLVYDVSNRASFDALAGWIDEVRRWAPVRTVLVANKVRCANSRQTDAPFRVVTGIEGQAFADAHGMQYFETSACSGDGVQELFLSLFRTALEHN